MIFFWSDSFGYWSGLTHTHLTLSYLTALRPQPVRPWFKSSGLLVLLGKLLLPSNFLTQCNASHKSIFSVWLIFILCPFPNSQESWPLHLSSAVFIWRQILFTIWKHFSIRVKFSLNCWCISFQHFVDIDFIKINLGHCKLNKCCQIFFQSYLTVWVWYVCHF